MFENGWQDSVWLVTLRYMVFTIGVSILVFAATARDWTTWNADNQFVLWLATGYGIEPLIRQIGCVLPTYWYQTLRFLIILPFCYVGLPTCLRSSDILYYFRALHIGLLESKGGYAMDLGLYKKDRLLVGILVIAGMLLDMCLTFGLMTAVGMSQLSAWIAAAISPAPTGEVADPIFDLISTTCNDIALATKDDIGESVAAARNRRAVQLQKELIRVKRVFKCATLPQSFLTILFFCSIVSGVNFVARDNHDHLELEAVPPTKMVLNGFFGLVAAVSFSITVYTLGRLCHTKRSTSDFRSVFVFATGVCSMYPIGGYFPVSAALGAIVASVAVRYAIGYDEYASKTLSNIWPHTSTLYNMSFAFITIGYFCSSGHDVVSLTGKLVLVSVVAYVIKSLLLTAICRCFKIGYFSSIILGATLTSKGTVQLALCTLFPLRGPSLTAHGTFIEEAMLLQLYTLVNYMVVLPCVYTIIRLIVHCIKK